MLRRVALAASIFTARALVITPAAAPQLRMAVPAARTFCNMQIEDGPKSGKCKWFNVEKGYGFIALDGEGDKDVFVHQSDIYAPGFRSLAEGESLEFRLTTDDKTGKMKAVDVTGPDGAYVQGGARRHLSVRSKSRGTGVRFLFLAFPFCPLAACPDLLASSCVWRLFCCSLARSPAAGARRRLVDIERCVGVPVSCRASTKNDERDCWAERRCERREYIIFGSQGRLLTAERRRKKERMRTMAGRWPDERRRRAGGMGDC